MKSFASAYANNDVAIISWMYASKIPGCLGFCIQREDTRTKKITALPAWVGFEGQKNPDWKMKDTSIWPVQKFNWKDLTAPKNGNYIYHIIPMVGKVDALKPVADKTLHLQTKPVQFSPGSGNVKAYFNRGILSTQFLAHQLPKSKNGPSLTALKTHIAKPGDPIRNALGGDLIDAIPSLLKKAMTEGGSCYLALYELTDPMLVADIIAAKDRVELILTNANSQETTQDEQGKSKPKVVVDGENAPFRKQLKKAGVKVYDRFVPAQHIGHNKFVLYVDQDGNPHSILSGSTNWTQNGLCAQSNNCIIIEDAALAGAYSDYWDRLLEDTKKNQSKQGITLRHSNQQRFPTASANPGVWFSPNTDTAKKPVAGSVNIDNDPGQPLDLKDLFAAVEGAEKSILFLEFQPGSPSILDKILSVQQRKPKLFIRGAATDNKAVGDYNTALFHGDSAVPDFYNVVAASAIKDQFAFWEKELLSAGHAIIHNKIVVVDPFTDNCRVFTGSHNNGYRASAFNDENLVSVKGNRELAAAYAAHIIDVYDHYRWRFTLQSAGKDTKGKFKAFTGLLPNDSWQDKYFGTATHPAVKHMTIPNPGK